MGILGLTNTVFSVYMWFKFLSNSINNNTGFWFSIFFPVAVNGCLWIPLFIIWPASFVAGTTTINIISFLSQLTYFGAFFAYWANLGGMYYTFYMKPTETGSTFATNSDAHPYFGTYIGLSLLNSLVTMLFVPDIVAFADKRSAEDAAEEARAEASGGSASADASSGGDGDAPSTVPDDNDDNIVRF